jgi:hypothetical protein
MLKRADFAISEDTAPSGLEWHTKQRELWLVMQTAHEHYTSAQAALENYKLEGRPVDGDYNRNAVGDERAAFEAYVEARLRFLEFMIDQSRSTNGRVIDASYEVAPMFKHRLWDMQLVCIPAASLIVVLILCAFMYFGERRTLHDLEQKTHETDSRLSVTTDEAKTLAENVDSLELSARERSSSTPLVSPAHNRHLKRIKALPKKKKQTMSPAKRRWGRS